MSSNTSAASLTYAAAAGQFPPSPTSAKYVPVHKRGSSDQSAASHRSPSPAPSDASTSSGVAHPRVYSIDTLLRLSYQPEVKVISNVQKERIKQVLPEIVMNRKMKKGIEYHAIQERIRIKAQPLAQTPPSQPNAPQQVRQRPGQRRQSRAVGTERRRNATKVVDEVTWRALRPARVVSGAVA